MNLHDPQSTTLSSIYSTIQLNLREMQDSWLSATADDIQGYADKNDMKNIYCSLKEFYCPTSDGSSPLLSADGTKILDRWAEPFEGVLNRPPSINDKSLEWLLQVPVNEPFDVTPTPVEVQIAICQCSSGKYRDLTQLQQKSIKRVDQRWQVNFWP